MSRYTASDLIDLGFDPKDPQFKADLDFAKSADCGREELVNQIFVARKRRREETPKGRTYTFDEAVSYLRGWLWAESDLQALSYNEVCAMFKNAAACVECTSDGINSRPSKQWQAQVKEKEA